MTVQKMKPCPKCKSTNVNATCWGMWKAWCRECLFEIASFLEEKDAIEAWNNLAPQEESKSGKDPILTYQQVSQYPDWIDIEMQDGNTVRYKR